MAKRGYKKVDKAVTWLSKEVSADQKSSITFRHYTKFQFKSVIAEIGDYVLVSNADSAEPDSEAGCDAARILGLYEDTTNKNDPYRAKVQWYTRPVDVPKSCFSNCEPIEFLEREVLEDHRPFDTDVSIETFFKKCSISLTFTKDTDLICTAPYKYICRYRVTPINKRKVLIEPVLNEERQAMQLLKTPAKGTPSKTPKSPTSLIKHMNRVSISDQRSWSVSKSDGTKLLLKKAILADQVEKFSPKKDSSKPSKMDSLKPTPKKAAIDTTPNSSRKLTTNNIEEVLSMELQENCDEELPVLIIRQHVPTTPKRKTPVRQTVETTPNKIKLSFNVDKPKTPTRSRKTVNLCESKVSPVKRSPSRRSGKPSVCYTEPESPVKRSSRNLRALDEDSDDEFASKTPKTPRTPRTPRATPGKTPKRKIISQLTPMLRTRAHSVDNVDEFLKDDRKLPGREQQLDEILSFVRTKLLDATSGCMYISGVPGTGKTATVCTALKMLKEQTDLPPFQLVEVNGMKITEPRQAYVHIYKQLTGKSVVWEQACTLLDKRFTHPGPRRTPTVLLVDELDALCTRRQDVLYSIMEWASHNSALLTVLAVANTMDLPERALAARVASRLGLTRLSFPPYSHSQLQTIVATRLAGANVTADAVQLIARKVAAVSGDARRALALCSRALELATAGEGAGLVQVQQALTEASSGVAVRAIQATPPAHRLMLRAVAAEVERTGSDETTLSRALATAGAIVTLDGRPYRSATQIRAPTFSQALAICSSLAASRLLLLDTKPAEPKLILNVSVDDVHYATRQITL